MAANKRKGILFILTSAFFFSLMTVFVRLSGDVPTMQKAFFRNIVAAILAAILLVRSKEGFTFQKKNLPDLFLRSSIGTAGIDPSCPLKGRLHFSKEKSAGPLSSQQYWYRRDPV